jgi:hypothetical protein
MFGLPADFAATGVQPAEIAQHRLEGRAAAQPSTTANVQMRRR